MKSSPYFYSAKVALLSALIFFFVIAFFDSQLSWDILIHRTLGKAALYAALLFAFVMSLRAANDYIESHGLGRSVENQTYVSDDSDSSYWNAHQHSINPANGLPMVGSVDIEGNPYGSSHDRY